MDARAFLVDICWSEGVFFNVGFSYHVICSLKSFYEGKEFLYEFFYILVSISTCFYLYLA